MTIPIASILSRVDDLLLDEDRTRWPVEERMRWINEAPSAIVTRKPSALSKHVTETLAAGTRQQIAGVLLMDVVRNIGSTGSPGRAIRRTDRQALDDAEPDWHSGSESATIFHFTFDDRVPRDFFVYPPARVGTKVETVQAVLPAEAADDGDLDIGAEYLEAVAAWVCYRCKFKDSENGNVTEASAHFQAFENALGIKAQADIAASPNQAGNSV